MTSKTDLLQKQCHWADRYGLHPDERGYLSSVDKNLYQPLYKVSRKAFENGSGSELLDTASRPAKMKALHSSSALGVNVFDYWVSNKTSSLMAALGLDKAIRAIRFEAQYSTGLTGNPPNLDIVLELEDGHTIGIESKFSEWLTPKTKSHVPFKSKYFASDSGLWKILGMPRAQGLAEAMYAGEDGFRYLDAAQLLKHSLGMATQLGNRFSLYYVYYDWPGPESEVHRKEIARFDELVDDSLGFKTLSYQDLFISLQQFEDIDQRYLTYLKERYFG